MKKYFLFLLLMAVSCAWDQYDDQKVEMAGTGGKIDNFTVTVGTGSVDCGLPALLFMAEDSAWITNLSGEGGRTYMACHLAPEFNQPGSRLNVTVRKPRVDETVICTAMGPMYPMVFVIRAEWVE